MAVSNEAVSTTPNPALEAVVATVGQNFTASAKFARAVYIGAAGDVTLILPDNDPVQFKNCLAGTILPVRCRQVSAASASPANIVALF
jgi:hypothetical protein